jgi:hypothetical protein
MLARALSKVPSRAVLLAVGIVVMSTSVLAVPIGAAYGENTFTPGNLLVSTSVWTTNANITAGTTQLPPNCGGTVYTKATCVTAEANGTYPQVFNNDGVDGSFGVTQPIWIDEITPSGTPVSQVEVPNSTMSGVTSGSDQMTTSFSSKSELALNDSTDNQYVDFMGYVAPSGAVDVSNADTPGAIDTTNTDSATPTYRGIAQLDQYGNVHFTETNAYSGNNGRAAILNTAANTIYTAGNAGNGSKPEPQGVVTGTGSQILSTNNGPESGQSPGATTPLGNFNIVQTGAAADTAAKDDNFRGLTDYNNVIYMTKGSGSNGVNTVYFLNTTGAACPSGSGLPSTTASLPTATTWTPPTYSTSNATLSLTTANPGLTPTNMCILNGFATTPASGATDSSDYPFGIWFASPTVLYVADEGADDNTYSSATNTYTAAAASTTAGLQKWVFNSSSGSWQLAYTLQNGLNLGVPYTVPSYPTGNNSYTSGTGKKATTVTGPWAPAVDGLRNLTGQVNADGTVTLYAATSTVSFSGDQGADPNALVSITDNLAATSLPSGETFTSLMAPTYGQVIRGVAFVPTTQPGDALPEAPWLPLLPIVAAVVGGGFFVWHRRLRGRASI